MKKIIATCAFCLALLPFSINAQSGLVNTKLYIPDRNDGPADVGTVAPTVSTIQTGSGSGNQNPTTNNPTSPGATRPSSAGSLGSGSNLSCRIEDFKSIVTCFGSVINTAIPLIIASTVLVIVWNIFQLIRKGDGENLKGIKDIILWGVIGLFCMLSIWGFVAILSNTFQLNNTAITPQPFQVPK
jgi:hypothetical protein